MKKLGVKGKYGGTLKFLVLYALNNKPTHAYGLMRKIEELTGFMPSSGAFFPIIRHLERHGLVKVEEVERAGRRVKVYSLSGDGVRFLEAHRDKVEEALRLARSFKRFNDSGCSRLFRIIGEVVENMDRLSDEQVEELSKAVLDFEYRVLGILRGGER
ncbi:MAG: PadR family transcriptional regulator [Infirmifilum sp.]